MHTHTTAEFTAACFGVFVHKTTKKSVWLTFISTAPYVTDSTLFACFLSHPHTCIIKFWQFKHNHTYRAKAHVFVHSTTHDLCVHMSLFDIFKSRIDRSDGPSIGKTKTTQPHMTNTDPFSFFFFVFVVFVSVSMSLFHWFITFFLKGRRNIKVFLWLSFAFVFFFSLFFFFVCSCFLQLELKSTYTLQVKMGKRHVDHESTQDAPTNKKRKTGGLSYHHDAVDDVAAAADTSRFEYHLNQSESADVNTSTASDVTYSLTTDLVDGVVLTDLCARKWRCGKPIGKLCMILFYLQCI